MKIKEIRDLIDFISQSELNEVNIETTDFKISVKKRPDISVNSGEYLVQSQKSPSNASQVMDLSENIEIQEEISEKVDPAKNLVEIKSPMIGTFYRAANPESPSFVEPGDRIKPGQTLCIIEAMKLFNEIESEVSGTIVKVLVENASPVEFDQPLYLVDPS